MAHAAGSEHRAALIEALRESRAGLDTAALATRLGLHPNTIRWHLGLLGDEGLVTSQPERRTRRGRPTIVYRLTPSGLVQGRDEFRILATMLTQTVAELPEADARAYETGRAWGKQLVPTPDPDHAVQTVVDLLDDEGFAAEVEGDVVSMRRCPFWSLAESNPEVICSMHHGLIDGALEATGSDMEVGELTPFVEPTLCVARLRQRARSTAAATNSSAR